MGKKNKKKEFVAIEISEIDRKALKAVGVTFPRMTIRDFRKADRIKLNFIKVPKGWLKVEHIFGGAIWTYVFLTDEKGRRRAEIELHPASFTVKAITRISIETKKYNYQCTGQFRCYKNVIDHGGKFSEKKAGSEYCKEEEIFTSRETIIRKDKDWWEQLEEGGKAEALAWLKKHYPKWQNPGVYWDKP